MKYLLIVLIMSCPLLVGQDFLYAQPDWFQPEIHAQSYGSFCEDPVPQPFITPEFYCKSTSFALSSFYQFKFSIHGYFSEMDCDGIFFRYVPSYIVGKDTLLSDKSGEFSINYVPIYPKQDLMIRIFGGFDYNRNGEEDYFFPYKGLRLKALLSDHFTLDGYWWAGQFRGDKSYYLTSPLIDGFYQPDDDIIYLDNLQGTLAYDNENVQVSLGRGKCQVGNNISGSIILNNAANDYGYFSSSLHFGRLTLSYMHGALTPDAQEVVNATRVDKFIALHKLDWDPSPKFNGFVGEEIVYGNRSLDLNYILPHTFWRIIEHNLEDRDNVLVFGGLKWKMNNRFTFYHNLLLDEFSQSKILTDWWGSKYALQAGVSYQYCTSTEQAILRNPRITMEVTAVRPWTYTHFIKWNKFSNDGIALGYPDGSNCLNYSLECVLPTRLNLQFAVNASYTRQGSVGNDFNLNTLELIPDIDNTKTHWLEGRITDTKKLRMMMEWKPLAHHFLRLGSTLSQIEKSDITQDLIFSYRTEF